MSGYERHYMQGVIPAEDGENGQPRITGYAAAFDTRSHDPGGFREVILPGAFDAVLDQHVGEVTKSWSTLASLRGRALGTRERRSMT